MKKTKAIHAFSHNNELHVLYDSGDLWCLTAQYTIPDDPKFSSHLVGWEWIKLELPLDEEEKEND